MQIISLGTHTYLQLHLQCLADVFIQRDLEMWFVVSIKKHILIQGLRTLSEKSEDNKKVVQQHKPSISQDIFLD